MSTILLIILNLLLARRYYQAGHIALAGAAIPAAVWV
jgi:hypothetical protein